MRLFDGKEIDLSINNNTEVRYLSLDGFARFCRIGRKKLECLIFWDGFYIYKIPLCYYILQGGWNNVCVNTIEGDLIQDRFNRARRIKILERKKIIYGEPDCGSWIENNLIIQK